MATLSDTGIPGLGSGILQPQLKNHWRITFAGIGGGVDSQPLSVQAVTVTRPSLEFAETELHRYNTVAWVQGKHRFNPLNLTVENDITGTASKVIQDQLQKQQWLTGAEGQWLAVGTEGSIYKFVTTIDQLDGNDQVVESWICEGCWLQSVNYTDLDYSSSDAVRIEMTVRFDHARQIIGGYDNGAGTAF